MTANEVPDEVEVKLEAASSEELGHVAQLRVLGAYRLRPRRAQHLQSRYFDTRNLALARAGIALRVRRAGNDWEATAKWSGRVAGSLHQRPELTVALPGEPSMPFTLPEGPLRTQLTAVVLGRRLAPILETDVHRRLRDLLPVRGAAGEPLAEVALDTVALRGPDGTPLGTPYYEVEIERRGGRKRDLTELSHALQQRFGLIPSPGSKFTRGLAELHGVGGVPVRGTETIAAGDSVASAARKIFAAQLRRVRAADPGTRAGRDAEALHEQRVALRRLRAAARTFAAGIPPRLREQFAGELRWLGQELGAVRDVDVQLVNLASYAEQLGTDKRRHLTALRRHLERERAARRATLVAALESRRYIRLLIALERFAGAPPPRRPRGDAALPVAKVGRRTVKRALRRLMKRGDAIAPMPEADDLHTLRIRAKRLRYVLEALRPIAGAPGRKLLRQLVRLQDVLGRFNDAMVAAASVRAYLDGPAAKASAEVRDALVALTDTELRRAGAAQSEFARAWERFTSNATRGQRRTLLKRLGRSAASARATGMAPAAPGRGAEAPRP
jgi:inorganic triphosphatase YgiF